MDAKYRCEHCTGVCEVTRANAKAHVLQVHENNIWVIFNLVVNVGLVRAGEVIHCFFKVVLIFSQGLEAGYALVEA